jgi:membrane fusion protein (multidrug efflux system)
MDAGSGLEWSGTLELDSAEALSEERTRVRILVAGSATSVERKIVRDAGLATTLFVLLALACGIEDVESANTHGPPPAVVETVLIEAEDVEDVLEFVGQLDSAHSVILKPEISGIVESVSFKEGTAVKKGDPLVRLKDAEQRARVREAEATRRLTKNQYDRARLLAERSAESTAGLERALAEYEIAGARLELAKIQLNRTVVRAPFDGVVGSRLVSPGERVSPGSDRDFGSDGGGGGGGPSGLVRIDSLDEMELIFTLPETVMAIARTGVKVQLRVSPFPGESFGGEIYFVDPRIDATSRRVLVKARVPNPEHKLRPGLFATLKVEISSRLGALMVPEDAVVYGRDGVFVWRIVDGEAVQVPVELGIRQPGRVELRSGVKAGERVVSAGTHKLRPGSAVRDLARHSDPGETDEP